jgi:outer membrane protein
MKNIFKYLLLLAFVSVSGLMSAQKAPKFGHINTQDLITAMPDRDSAQKKLEVFAKDLDSNMEGMQVEFNKKYETYTKEKDNLNALVRQTREGELQDFQQRMQAYQEQAQQEVQKKQSELMQPIITKAKKAIEEVGKENGFTIIYETSAIQFMSPEVQDVLPLVKAKLGIKATAAAAPAQQTAPKK